MSDIIALLKKRDEKGLSMLYDQYAPTLLGVIVRIVKRKDIGEEILQQSLLKAWNNIDKYDAGKGNFFTWLITIARRASIDQVRLAGYRYYTQAEEVDDANYFDYKDTQNEDKIDTASLLNVLDDNKKAVLDLIYLQGYTHQDAADVLNIPLGTVKSRLRLAIASLRNELKEERNLFLGMLFMIILTMLRLWI